MKPNSQGGRTLIGPEIDAGRWSMNRYMPALAECVGEQHENWDNDEAVRTLPLDTNDAEAMVDAVQQALAIGDLPPEYVSLARGILIDAGRMDPGLRDHLRRWGRRLLESIADVD